MPVLAEYKLAWKKSIGINNLPEGDKLDILKQTLAQIVYYNLRDPITRQTAEQILDAYRVPNKAWLDEIVAVWDWVKKNVRYTFDPLGVERFQTARTTLETRHGDCDDHATLVCSLLTSIGHESCMYLCDSDPRYPGRFSHAVAAARLPKPIQPYGRSWIILETTKDMTFGWKVPTATHWDQIPINPSKLSENKIVDAPPLAGVERIDITHEGW